MDADDEAQGEEGVTWTCSSRKSSSTTTAAPNVQKYGGGLGMDPHGTGMAMGRHGGKSLWLLAQADAAGSHIRADAWVTMCLRAWRFGMSLDLQVAATINCVGKTGAMDMYIISAKGINGRLKRLPSAYVGDMVLSIVKKGKPQEGHARCCYDVVQSIWHRKDGVFIYLKVQHGEQIESDGMTYHSLSFSSNNTR
ncbi:hypothetical protein QYE76_003785 [Lolium multiflorum]|uniref:Uncharacterized protein n=1 Tax=Lolium multiflorum TaxID=4521 RepID=A0AAD8RR12_LOLMU|nr:hypothetical protein QYE76_003783 [Lolium multiflorum]KAK1629470.1 hypothetical protein QYE76_003785 [Lolium multiflorum]